MNAANEKVALETVAGAVMVGALAASAGFPLEKGTMLEAVKSTVPPRAVEVNVRAFENGYDA